MKINKVEKIINKILKENCAEVGIFITLLSDAYMQMYNIDEKKFFDSLKNSLKILKKEGE